MRLLVLALLTHSLLSLAVNAQNLFTSANGPYGGTVTSMVVTADGALVAGTDNGTYRSTDNGEEWIRSSEGIPITSILTLARSPKGSLFAGTVDVGIYRSTDNGTTWHRVNSGAFSSYVWDIAVRSSDSMIVIAASDNGYVSTDDGDTWTSLEFPLGPYAVAVDSTQAVCVMVDNQLLRSRTPLSGNWDTSTISSTVEWITTLGIAPDGSFIAGADEDGFHRSTDLGTTWQKLNLPPELSSPESITTVGGNRVYITSDGGSIYVSEDNGETWRPFGDGFQIVYSVLYHVGGSEPTFFAMTSDGIQKTTDDGLRWTLNSSYGIQAMFISVLARRPGDNRIFAGTHNGLLYATDGDGLEWEWMAGFERPYYTSVSGIDFLPDGSMVISTFGEGVFTSSDSGRTWVNRWSGPATTKINAMTLSPLGTILTGCDSGRIYRSTNGGLEWELVAVDPSSLILAFSRDSSGRIWAGTSSNIYVSADDGKTWTASGSGITTSYISSLATGPDGRLYAGSYNGNFFFSTDGGVEWKKSVVDPSAILIVGLMVDTNGVLFAGTINRALYRSTNSGVTWAPYNTGISSYSSYAMILDRSAHIYVGTAGSGAFRSVDRSSSAPFIAPEIHIDRALTVMPSPAAERVSIQFQIDRPSLASLELISMHGRRARRLDLGWMPVGDQRVEILTSDLPAGEWIVLLRAGGDTYKGRVVIVR